MLFDLARMARHEQLHVIFGFFITVRAINHHLVKLFRIKVTNATANEIAFFINQRRGGGTDGFLAHFLP